MSTEEALPPNFGRLETALRSIGYSFEAAVADLIDNSIDANARQVLVRLFIRRDGHLDLVIRDDGEGMTEQLLREAMRFGSDVSQEIKRLGKFGLGLKLASLSQAKEVHVLTARRGTLAGRAWLEHGVAAGFKSTVFDVDECTNLASKVIPDRPLRPSGTLVWWSHLYRIGQHHGSPAERAQKLLQRLEKYLALAFHRFLSGRPRKVEITLDIFSQDSARTGIPMRLDPLDPFGYEHSGRSGFPAAMYLDGRHRDRISIKAHIWPPNSSLPGYKLPGGANSRQGL